MTHLRGCLISSLVFCPAGQCLPREGTEESGISSPSTDTPLEGLQTPYTEPLMSPGRLSTQAGPGGRRPPYPCSLSSQARCEHPSISLHIIGLNRPTDDLEMTLPDEPRMRFASFLQLCDNNSHEISACLCGLCGLRVPI